MQWNREFRTFQTFDHDLAKSWPRLVTNRPKCYEPQTHVLAVVIKSGMHIYKVRPRRDKHGVDLISDALPFGRMWYTKPHYAIGYAQFFSRSHDAVIRVYDESGNVIETHEHRGDFKEWRARSEAKGRLRGDA